MELSGIGIDKMEFTPCLVNADKDGTNIKSS